MPKSIDLTGLRFGMLTAIRRVGSNARGNMRWEFQCDCGNITTAFAKDVKNGNTKSCGCYRHVFSATHGMYNDVDYERWKAMKKRCTNPNDKYFHRYGGRGIKVCDEWLHNFQAFKEHICTLPHYGEPGYTLDRIDNSKNYEPGNIRWATPSEQAKNRG